VDVVVNLGYVLVPSNVHSRQRYYDEDRYARRRAEILGGIDTYLTHGDGAASVAARFNLLHVFAEIEQRHAQDPSDITLRY
jgi:hypothetical protein